MPSPIPPIGDLRFFLDRSLGAKQLPGILRAAGWKLTTLNERYGSNAGESVSDAKWIADAASESEILLCKDLAVGWVVAESHAIRMHDAHVFGLANAGRLAPEMAGIFLVHQTHIAELHRRPGPFLYSLSENSLKERKLAER
jgi:hypothetical protein